MSASGYQRSKAPESQHVLIQETKETSSYVPADVLYAWHHIAHLLPEDGFQGWGEFDWLTDEDRIVALFQLLNGSPLQDLFFSSHADWDGGCTLETRREDE